MNTKSSISPASGSKPAGPVRFALQTTVHPGATGEPVFDGKQARWLTPFILAGLLLTAAPSDVRAQDAWFGPDKLLHFTCSFIITSAGYIVAREGWEWEHDRARAFGVGMGAAAGIGKELYDVFIKRTYVSGKDLVWDGIGIGVGVVTANLLRDSLGPDSGGGYRFVGLRTAARLDCSRLTREAILQGMARSAIAFPTAPAAGIAIGAPRGAAIAVDTGLRPSTLRLPRATRPPGSFRFEGD